MGSVVFLVLFLAVALRRPDVALLIYFVHWAFCRALRRPTVFDRVESWLRRVNDALRQASREGQDGK